EQQGKGKTSRSAAQGSGQGQDRGVAGARCGLEANRRRAGRGRRDNPSGQSEQCAPPRWFKNSGKGFLNPATCCFRSLTYTRLHPKMCAKWRTPNHSRGKPSRTTASLKNSVAAVWVWFTKPRTRGYTDSWP